MTRQRIEVVTTRNWVADELAQATDVDVSRSFGLDLPFDLCPNGWWMPAAHAARLFRQDVPMKLTAPGPDWLSQPLLSNLIGRTVLSFRANATPVEVLESAGGWCKPAEAKIEGFDADWRTPEQLEQVLESQSIPGNTFLQWTNTLLDLSVEYRAYVLGGAVVTMSPYLHLGQTYYDMDGDTLAALVARPGPAWAQAPEAWRFASGVAKGLAHHQPSAYCLDVGYDRKSGSWVVVEANPAWCSAWYGCDIDAVAATIIRACNPTPREFTEWAWAPDAYFVERASMARLLPRCLS